MSVGGTIPIKVQHATFVKVGNLVFCTFDFFVTATYDEDKNAKLTLEDLPFVSTVGAGGGVGSVYFSFFKNTDVNITYLSGVVRSNSDIADLWYSKAPGQNLTELLKDDIKTGTQFIGTVHYVSAA